MNSFKKNYLVSVIIPTFNGGERLINVVNSIMDQSIGLENIELIIVDDGSTDNITKKIISHYQSEYPENIKAVFLDKNSGYPGKPRNIGLKHVSSDYVIFSDHDDYYLKDGFKILYNAIKKYDSDIVGGNHYNNVNGEKILHMKYLKENIINMNPMANQENFNLLNKHIASVLWCKIIKTDFIIKNNLKFVENSYNDDGLFYLDAQKCSPKITILPQNPVYVYTIYQQSTCRTHNINSFNISIRTIYYLFNRLRDIPFNIDIFFEEINSLLINFIDLNNLEKNKAILKIYEFEKYLEQEFHLHIHLKRIEMNILNKAIMQKKFRKAILLSHIYQKLYHNKIIQKLFYKFYLK